MSAPALARPPAATRLAVVVHPDHRIRFPEVRASLTSFEGDATCSYETTGHGANDSAAIAELARNSRANVVIAAGGDGTVSTVSAALCALPAESRPDLAILPLGTANNLARSYGLSSVRTDGSAALTRALSTLHDGATTELDVGEANGTIFVGSFALGMDAAILHRRNELRSRYPLDPKIGGYPLYLASCAIEALAHRELDAAIEIDGQHTRAPLYNLLLTCCPVYAGEFRFAGRAGNRGGRLGAYAFGSRREFLTEYTRAWRRHVRHGRGEAVREAENARWVRRVTVRLPTPVVAQLDGEETAACDAWSVTVRPGAIRLRVPAISSG